MAKKWITIPDAAEYLGVSRDFIRDLINDGLPCYKVRRVIFIKVSELDKMIEATKL